MIGRRKRRFNLKKEANRAFKAFPHLRSNTVFIDAGGKDGPEAHVGDETVKNRLAFDNVLDIANDLLEEKRGSIAFTENKRLRAIYLNPDEPAIMGSAVADRAHAFDHEMGHFLVPKAHTGPAPYKENAADAFAAIRHIQRFGNDPHNLILLSGHRSDQLLSAGDTSHLSAPMLNRIIADSRYIDFKKLTPKDTVRAAAFYARKFSPKDEDMARAIAVFSPAVKQGLSGKEHLRLMAETALATEDKFSFEIGASYFRPLLAPEGSPFASEERAKLRAAFAARAGHFKMNGLADEFKENKKDVFSRLRGTARRLAPFTGKKKQPKL